jgi:hypothetical protein
MFAIVSGYLTHLPSWLLALLALSPFMLGLPLEGEGGDGGDGGDAGDQGGGNLDDMPTPGPGAWRGENDPAAAATAAAAAARTQTPDPAAAQARHDAEMAALRTQNDTLQRQFNDLGANYRRTQAALAAAAGIAGPGEPKTPEDVRKEKLLTQFFDLFPKAAQPHMKRLFIEQPERLAALLEQDPKELAAQVAAPEQRHWQGVATQTSEKVYDAIAPAILGAGKTAKDLDAETRGELREGFARWINRDQTGARADRYEQQDPALVTEYATWFKARFVDPGRRTAAAAVITRGAQTARLPVSGGGNQAIRTPNPKPNDEADEDAIHKNAWTVAQSLRG